MSTQQRSPEPALKTSLQAAYAAASAEQPSSLPTQEEQDKYLEGRPRATAHHLGIALQHAHQIQAQKDAEEMILDRIIELLALPSSPSADPATPSPQDAQLFKSALYPFRPSDYDSLVTERNNEDLCGYGLCPRKNRRDDYGKGQSFRFKYGAKGSGPGGRGRSVDIVSSDNIEKWCSDQCAERALYIRVQLGEKPVWERRANDTQAKNIQLLEEGRAKSRKLKAESSKAPLHTSQLDGADMTAGMRSLNIQDTERSRQELALERGDTSNVLRHSRVDVHIKENEYGSHSSASAPQPRPEDATGGSIEGYVPQEQRDESSTQNETDLLDQI
jgi:hypothetical protein